jgi:hypothetical protein
MRAQVPFPVAPHARPDRSGRLGLWFLAVLALSALAMPVGAAVTSYVPGMVMGRTVPAFVSGADEGSVVTLSLGPLSAERESAGEDLTVEVAGVAPGLHAWDLSITEDGVTTTTHGHVLVDDRLDVVQAALLALRGDDRALSALANLTSALEQAQDELRAGQNSTEERVAGLPEDVADNVTAAIEAFAVQLSNGTLLGAVATPPAAPPAETAPAAAPAAPLALWSAVAAAALALAAAVGVALGWLQGRRHRRETMVLLLALAARSGITPQSQEFQLALQALEGGAPPGGAAPTPPAGAADGA